MSDNYFSIGDRVFYCGEKLRAELAGKTGWIHAKVDGNPYGFVVEFPETKNCDSYVMHRDVLTAYKPPPGKRDDGPEVQPRRRKADPDLE